MDRPKLTGGVKESRVKKIEATFFNSSVDVSFCQTVLLYLFIFVAIDFQISVGLSFW